MLKKLTPILLFVLMAMVFITPLSDASAKGKSSNTITTSSTPIKGAITPNSTLPGGSGFVPEPGDILYTSNTSYGGLTGHVGITLYDGTILHAPGPGLGIHRVSFGTWMADYPNTEVFREPYRTIANEAASWALNNYWITNSNATYNITTAIYSTNPTYCSKLTWQAYYFGTGSAYVEDVPYDHIVDPKSFLSYFRPPYQMYSVFNSL